MCGQAPKGESSHSTPREMAGTQCSNSWPVLLCGSGGRVHGMQSSSVWTQKPLPPGCGGCILGLKYSQAGRGPFWGQMESIKGDQSTGGRDLLQT